MVLCEHMVGKQIDWSQTENETYNVKYEALSAIIRESAYTGIQTVKLHSEILGKSHALYQNV